MAAALLRAARERAGVTQSVLAQRAGTKQSNVSAIENGERSPTYETLEKLINRSRSRLTIVPSVHDDAPAAAERIATAVAAGSRQAAFRAFLDYSDGLSNEHGATRVGLTVARPQRTGDPFWDAALAAVAQYWLDEEKLPHPDWLGDEDRHLEAPQGLRLTRFSEDPDFGDVPPAFAGRNVLIEAGTLASV